MLKLGDNHASHHSHAFVLRKRGIMNEKLDGKFIETPSVGDYWKVAMSRACSRSVWDRNTNFICLYLENHKLQSSTQIRLHNG